MGEFDMRDFKLNQYSGVVFDLDGTLVHKEPNLEDFVQQLLEKRGLVIDAEQSKEAQRLSFKFWEDPVNYNNDPKSHGGNQSSEFWVTFPFNWELTFENNQQTDVKPLIEKS